MALALALAATLWSGLWLAARAAGPAGPVPPPQPPPFDWVIETPTGRAAAIDPPLLPDLSVQWIERTPRYHRYCIDYSRGLPELCAGTEDEPRFPEPGEIVTWTAHIANQGRIASPAVPAVWQVDGQAALSQPLPALGPGVTATLAFTMPWPAAPLSVTLHLDPAAALGEVTRANNMHGARSDALYLEVLVHPLVDAAFGRRPNLAGSWGFADWMQAQVQAMNANLAASAYPSAPQGAADRVRIDRIVVTEDVGGSAVLGALDYDGRWTFRVEPDDPDTPQDEAALSAEAYAAAFAAQIDWGLIHELTHQIGAIDLYQLNVAGSFQNQVLDGDGRPLLMGFQWPRPDLMGGGDLGDYPWQRYSEHTVLALQSNAGQRRGYYGEYLFDLPAQASLLVLDNRGQPLPNAQVAAYQSDLGTVRSQAAWSGITGSDGRLALPARAVPFGGLTTATGHTLAPNPFGAVDVVGWNGQLLLGISRDGQHFYTWWPITDFNLARWQGQSSYQRTVATHLPPAGAPAPPPRLDGLVDGLDVALAWQASPTPGVMAYRVYRGEEPDFYPLALITTTTALTAASESLHTARYAVTAMDAQGRESGFSPLFRAQRLILPAAVAADPATGQRTVLDRHDGSLAVQLADDRWVGRQGSVHLGLTGSQGLTRNGQGQLLVAVTNEDRVTVIDPQWPVADVAPQVVNWFGRERFVTGTLAGPASVIQVGPAFDHAIKARPRHPGPGQLRQSPGPERRGSAAGQRRHPGAGTVRRRRAHQRRRPAGIRGRRPPGSAAGSGGTLGAARMGVGRRRGARLPGSRRAALRAGAGPSPILGTGEPGSGMAPNLRPCPDRIPPAPGQGRLERPVRLVHRRRTLRRALRQRRRLAAGPVAPPGRSLAGRAAGQRLPPLHLVDRRRAARQPGAAPAGRRATDAHQRRRRAGWRRPGRRGPGRAAHQP